MRQGLSYSISKDTMSASVQVPALIPRDNLMIPAGYDWYRITAVVGIVPDHLYTDFKYRPIDNFNGTHSVYDHTEWFTAKKGSSATELQLNLPVEAPAAFSLMLLSGISFGRIEDVDYIRPVKYVGAAKVIGMR